MRVDEIASELWKAHQDGEYYPATWRNRLTVDEAYQVQARLLHNRVAAGAVHIGWKVGLTADVVRGLYDAKEPVFGYLLEEGGFRSGHTFTYADLYPPLMETEILITLKDDLHGPGIERTAAKAAIGTIAPAFEVPERRAGGLEVDFALGLVDNVSQRAYVWGDELPITPDFEFADVELELRKNDGIEARARGGDVMDHQLDTLSWLANTLPRYGMNLRSGQRVISGSFTKPAPVEKGDRYTACFSGVGEVSMSFS